MAYEIGTSRADDLLDALDPEQREVASALRGPVRVLAGAGTGKTRAITHRIAYGVATGVYDPIEVLAVTFTTRAAGEMRGRLRALGAGPVQARTFHSAALRQVRYFWPKVYGGAPPELTESKIPIVAGAARRNRLEVEPGPAARPRRRDRVGQGQQRPPDDYARLAPAARPRGQRARRRHGGPRLRQLRGAQARPGPHRHGGRPAVRRRPAQRGRADRRRGAPAVQVVRRRRVPGRQPDPVGPARPVARRSRRDLRRGRPRPDDLLLRRRPRRLPHRLPDASSRHARRSSSCATTARPRRSSTPANRIFPRDPEGQPATAHVQLRAQRDAGPELTWHEAADEVAEAEAVADADRRACATPARPLREIAVLFRINAQSEAFEEALTARGIPYVVRGAARFFERPEVRQAVALLRGEARARTATTSTPATWSTGSRAVLSAMGWSVDGARPRAARPATDGSRCRRWSPWPPTSPRRRRRRATLTGFVAELDRRAHEQHAPVAEGVTLATLHAAKGLEWDAVFLCGLQEGSMPITYADTPAAVEEERRLLYVGITRARVHLWLSWSLARNPGGQARRKPSPLPGRPATGRVGRPSRVAAEPRRTKRRSRQARRGLQAVPAPADQLAGAQPRLLLRVPGALRRGALRAAARLAQGAGRRAERAGVRGLLRRHPRGARRGQARPTAPRCARSTGSARPSSRSTPTSCSGSSPEDLRRRPRSQSIKWFARPIAAGVPCSSLP